MPTKAPQTNQRRREASQPVAVVFSRRLREARDARGWTQQQLAERMGEIGFPINRVTIAKLESGKGRARRVTLEEVLALSAALGVAPVHLITPLDDDADVAITSRVVTSARLVRGWMRGELLLPLLPDVDLMQIPLSELRAIVYRELTRDMDRLTLAMVGEDLTATANRIAEEIRNPKEEQ